MSNQPATETPAAAGLSGDALTAALAQIEAAERAADADYNAARHTTTTTTTTEETDMTAPAQTEATTAAAAATVSDILKARAAARAARAAADNAAAQADELARVADAATANAHGKGDNTAEGKRARKANAAANAAANNAESMSSAADAAEAAAAALTAHGSDTTRRATAAALAAYDSAVADALKAGNRVVEAQEAARPASEAAEAARNAVTAAKERHAELKEAARGKREAWQESIKAAPEMAPTLKEASEEADREAGEALKVLEQARKDADRAEAQTVKPLGAVSEARRAQETAEDAVKAAEVALDTAIRAQARDEMLTRQAAMVADVLKAGIPNLSAEALAFGERLSRVTAGGTENAQGAADALSGALYAATRQVLQVYQLIMQDTRAVETRLVIGAGQDADTRNALATELDHAPTHTVDEETGKRQRVAVYGKVQKDGEKPRNVKASEWRPEARRVYVGLQVSTREMQKGVLGRAVVSKRGQYDLARAALKHEQAVAAAISAELSKVLEQPAAPAVTPVLGATQLHPHPSDK